MLDVIRTATGGECKGALGTHPRLRKAHEVPSFYTPAWFLPFSTYEAKRPLGSVALVSLHDVSGRNAQVALRDTNKTGRLLELIQHQITEEQAEVV